jgi:polyferredoxin
LVLKNVELMSLEVQVRLREILDAREASQHGEREINAPDVMVMVTCREELGPKVERGELNSHLAEHLGNRRLVVPPLRARKRDIPDLVEHFVAKHAGRLQKPIKRVDRDVLQQLLSYDFPLGNVQELEECIERAIILAEGEEIGLEHLFLRAQRQQEGLSYNLLQTGRLRGLLKTGLWPSTAQMLTALFFAGIFVLLFAEPVGMGYWGLVLVWSVWWPLLLISFLLAGRAWCAVCPIGALTQVIQRVKHFNRSVPAPFKKYDYLFVTVGFLLIMWAEEVTEMRHSTLATGLLLLAILVGAAVVNTLYERSTWCRHLCPLGGVAGVCSMASVVELRPTMEVCSNQCTTHNCYKGTEDVAGCPLFRHMMFVNTNQHCKLCMYCVRSCPHDAVQLNLRLPAQETWTTPEATRSGLYLFAATLLGIFFPVYLREIEGMEVFGGSVTLFTLAFLAAAAAPVGFFRLTGWLFARGEDFLVQNLWRQVAYTYLPLVGAVYTAYHFCLIEQLQTYHLRLLPVAGGRFVFQWPAYYPFVMLFVGVGLLLSFYSLDRMLYHVPTLSTAQRRSFHAVHAIAQTAYTVAAVGLMLGG